MRRSLFPMGPPTSPRGPWLLFLATLRSLAVLMRWRPDVALATGGYVCVPGALAAWLCRVPLVVFLPDVVPGKAVRSLLPLARALAVTTDASLSRVPGKKAVVTGYPVRAEFLSLEQEPEVRVFDIPGDATVLMVAGGSQGARHINQALASALSEILNDYYVIHVCGPDRYAEAVDAARHLGDEQRKRYRLYPFFEADEMAAALSRADLVVCRSGASVLGELPATATPAVLVPLPLHGVHQRENAEYLMTKGAAVVLEDEDLTGHFKNTVLELLGNRERLTAMSQACGRLARPDAASRIVQLMEEVSA